MAESQYSGDYRYWPIAMTKCGFASSTGGDLTYHCWIGGTSYSWGMEEKFHCGIGNNWGGAGSMVCTAIGYL